MARVPTSSPLSSLQSSEATFHTASPESSPRFQSTQPLPFELEQYLRVYLEESLFQQAFRFLLSLVTASAGNHKKKVLIPPPEYLATIATITIHPRITTRAQDKEQRAQSILALQLLNTILKTAGPVNANLTDAYKFRNLVPSDDESNDSKEPGLGLVYADSQNVFKCSDDFWAVVGWALNCSCLPNIYQERWKYWKHWLDHILDVLELDWELKENANPMESLIWQYVSMASGGHVAHRRIVRAIFADGTTKSLNEFDQIFPRELKKRQANQETKKQEVIVNVDEEIYGDWMQKRDSLSEDDETSVKMEATERSSKRIRNRTPRTRSLKAQLVSRVNLDDDESETTDVDDDGRSRNLGPPDSIIIRLRLLELLVVVTSQPNLSSLFVDLHELFTVFVEVIRPLPVPAFERITMASRGVKCLKSDTIITLCEFLMQRIVDSEGYGSRRSTLDPMTPERLITECLPYAASANSIEMQAKLNLLIESVLRIQLDFVKDQSSLQALSEALNTGIQKRQSKAEPLRKRKGLKASEEEAFKVLGESSMRMTFVLMQKLGSMNIEL